ncbi:MAG: segregation/condensation protein A [Erysipelotrichaceae bacterium]|nr:segregation/condensation protein A [Erysipelotrichaceae bacterium]MDD4642139.1 segregation/condensation protein A [Erysipelotrichaceae bacterium]
MTFLVSIDKFDGPLDLMLHLIKEKELDLFDLNMDILVDQYVEYLNNMDRFHLEIASEYLAELAGLLEYKSKQLLPNSKDIEQEDDEDPKEKLVRRLIEYQKFKEISVILTQRFIDRNKQFAKTVSFEFNNADQENDLSELNGNPYDLMKAMNRCLRHVALNQPLQMRSTTSELTVEQVVNTIKDKFSNIKGSFSFIELLKNCYDINEAIITFLAVLELIKIQDVYYNIDENDEIWLKWSNVYE